MSFSISTFHIFFCNFQSNCQRNFLRNTEIHNKLLKNIPFVVFCNAIIVIFQTYCMATLKILFFCKLFSLILHIAYTFNAHIIFLISRAWKVPNELKNILCNFYIYFQNMRKILKKHETKGPCSLCSQHLI